MAISDETTIGGEPLAAIPLERPAIAVEQSVLPLERSAIPLEQPVLSLERPVRVRAPLTSSRPCRRLRGRQLASDLLASAVAAGVAAGWWNLYGPADTSALKISTFSCMALVVVMITTAGTRASATEVGRVVVTRANRFAQTLFNTGLVVAMLFVIALTGVFGAQTPVIAIVLVASTSLLLVPAGRAAARAMTEPVRIVLVGSGTFAVGLRTRLLKAHRVELTAIVSDAGSAFADAHTIERLCERYKADALLVAVADPISPPGLAHLFVAPSSTSPPDGHQASASGPASRPDVDAMLRLSRRLPVSVAVQLSDGGSPLLFKVGGAPANRIRLFKRSFDVIVSAVGLLLSVPLLLVLMACVGLESGLPLLFRQRRLGEGRDPFHIVKLRTMRTAAAGAPRLADPPHDSAEPGTQPRTPLSNTADPRLVTKVGAVLRRTSLDELPQLVNVLRGEMSLVGPRPFVPEECEALPAWAAPRFSTRPGLTGMWQVCGQHSVSVDELCWLDLFYVCCWSLAADVRILLLTPARVLRGSRRAPRQRVAKP